MGHFGDGPQAITCTGTEYGQQKLTAKSIKPTQTQNTIIYYLHKHAHKRNTNYL